MRFRWREAAARWIAAPPPPSSEEPREPPELAFAEILLDEGREELGRADGKASLLLSASGVIFSVLVGSALNGRWSPSDLGPNPTLEIIFWLGVLCAAVGLILVSSAVIPRTKHIGNRAQLAYFGHVVRYREKGFSLRRARKAQRFLNSKDELKKAIIAASSGTFDRTVDQVWSVSMIVHKKYRRIRYAFFAYGLAVILCSGSFITNDLLR